MNRARLLMVATLPLYLGPLLAGLSGQGWAAVPVFIALFALWLVVMRPAQWPRDLSRWSGATLVAALAQVMINALIVVVLFAVGRGIGGIAGFLPSIPAYVPVGLSFLAVPLSRLVWNPAQAAEMDAFLDDAIRSINDASAGFGAGHAPPPADPMVAALLDLPDEADPVLTADALDAALRAPGGAARLSMLEDALDQRDPPRRALCEALILWATDPARSPQDAARGSQFSAFMVAGADHRLMHLFASRALPLLQAQPDLWFDFPDQRQVGIEVDETQPEPLQQALSALARALEAATPPDERWRFDEG